MLFDWMMRAWRKRPARTLLTVMSVAIGTAAVLGNALSRDSVQTSLTRLSSELEGPPSVSVTANDGRRFDPAIVPDMSDIAGVAAVVPTALRPIGGRSEGARWRTTAVGVPLDSAWIRERLNLIDGRWPENAGEAMLDSGFAAGRGIELGATVDVQAGASFPEFEIVGFVDTGRLTAFQEGANLVLPLSEMQAEFNLNGFVDRVSIVYGDRTATERTVAAVRQRLPKTLTARERISPFRVADENLRAIDLAMLFSAALSIAMAAFIVVNTLRMNFAERRRELAIFRALGATGGQVVSAIYAEAAALGALGGLVGLPLGWLAATALTRTLLSVANAPLAAVDPWSELVRLGPLAIGLAVCVGPLCALVAAWLPARSARTLSPIEAIADVDTSDREGTRVVMGVVCALVLLVSSAAMIGVVTDRVPPQAALVAGVAMLLSFVLLTPVALAPCVRLAKRLLPVQLELAGDLAVGQMLRRPTRTALSIAVIIVAVANGVGMGNAVLNQSESLRRWYKRAFHGDYVLFASPGVVDKSRAPDDPIFSSLRAMEGVAQLSAQRFRTAVVDGEPATFVIRELAGDDAIWDLVDAEKRETVRGQVRESGTIVSSVLAKRLNKRVGESVRVDVGGRIGELQIAAVIEDYLNGGLTLYADLDAARNVWEVGAPDLYVLSRSDAASDDALRANLEQFARDRGLLLESFAILRRRFDGPMDAVTTALLGVMALGLVVGGFGVANTLAINVMEQSREIALLRVAGATSRQLLTMVIVQGAMMGAVGALWGGLSGLLTAFNVHLCMRPLLGRQGPFSLHLVLLTSVLAGAAIVTVVAAIPPGRRAARLDPLLATSGE